jgi:hypothetical protein
MHGHKLCAIRKGSLDLDLVHELRNSFEHIRSPEKPAPEIHELGHGSSVPDKFQELSRDQGNALRVIESHSASQALLGQDAGLMDDKFI